MPLIHKIVVLLQPKVARTGCASAIRANSIAFGLHRPCTQRLTKMYDQVREDYLFIMFYAAVAMLSLIACCYLLFRRANAIAPDVMSAISCGG